MVQQLNLDPVKAGTAGAVETGSKKLRDFIEGWEVNAAAYPLLQGFLPAEATKPLKESLDQSSSQHRLFLDRFDDRDLDAGLELLERAANNLESAAADRVKTVALLSAGAERIDRIHAETKALLDELAEAR